MTPYSPYHSQVNIILALTERILSPLTSSWLLFSVLQLNFVQCNHRLVSRSQTAFTRKHYSITVWFSVPRWNRIPIPPVYPTPYRCTLSRTGVPYASPRACSSTGLCFASVGAISSSRRTTVWSAEEGGVTGAFAVLASVSLFTSSASWANLSLDSLGNWSWNSRKIWSSATGTSRGSSLCAPPFAIIRGGDRSMGCSTHVPAAACLERN